MTMDVLEHQCLSIGADFSLSDGAWLNKVRVGELMLRVVILGGARLGRRTKHISKLRTRHTSFTRESVPSGAFRFHMPHNFYVGKQRLAYFQEVTPTSEVQWLLCLLISCGCLFFYMVGQSLFESFVPSYIMQWYNHVDSRATLADKFNTDYVMHSLLMYNLTNKMAHTKWEDVLMCPTFNESRLDLPAVCDLGARNPSPLCSFVEFHTRWTIISSCYAAVGYMGCTPHGEDLGCIHEVQWSYLRYCIPPPYPTPNFFFIRLGNRSNAAMDALFRYLIRWGRLDSHIWTIVEQQLGFVRNSPVLMEYLRSVLNQAYTVAGSNAERHVVDELITAAPLDPPTEVNDTPESTPSLTASLSAVPSWTELRNDPDASIHARYESIIGVCTIYL